MKSHLQIMKEAYDACGIIYATINHIEDGVPWTMLVLCREDNKEALESQSYDYIGCTEHFMEFENGEVASY